MDDVRIAKAGVDQIQELEPLWRALHAQHLSVDPELPGIPMRLHEDAWERRCRLYRAWLSAEDAFLLTAEHRRKAVGYALTHMHEADESWDTHGRFAVLESIAVLPEMRRQGIGRKLMLALYAELRTLGVTVLEIGVVATNESARRFYERQGFGPWLIHFLGTVPGLPR